MNPQEIIKKHIKHGKIAHAYLLAGPSECADQKERFVTDIMNLFNVPLANRMTIGKNESAITIGMMRNLKTITASSTGNTPRVVAIYNADYFTMQAANAFLKTLEEPASRTIFFLLASSRAGILPTILSRVWTVRFSPIISDLRSVSMTDLRSVSNHPDFFQKPLAERYAINEKLAKSNDHGKQFVADLIAHLRYEAKNEIKKAAEILPHAVEAYELLHLPGAPYRLILDTFASYDVSK